ncbi:hypothetical protein SCUCBS95973_000018 [Sporothrix curviconia]|uniref:Zn(2)-C6 fungal-type domain-containing protein n=1 Tax=Sporothrix curviconia TaxID=1260050 RepID=A0ABP0AK04_9PEZI
MMSDPGGHAAASGAAPTSKRRLRRVADTSRKRSVQSCDFCRKRRCKCVPQPSGDGCLMCHSQGVACSYTLPRKARFYGSVEDLSDRFKCLEAIVRGSFPNDPIATVPDLLRLGDRLGLSMPDLTSDATGKLSLDDLVNNAGSSASKSVVSDQASNVESRDDGHRTSSVAGLGDVGSMRDDYDMPGSEQGHSEQGHPGSTTTDTRPLTSNDTAADSADSADTNDGNPSNNSNNSANQQDESSEAIGLIRDTTGQEHFIGSSGSLQFMGQLRRLLLLSQHDASMARSSSNSNYHSSGGYQSTRPSSQRLTTTFTEEDAAQALEADNTGGQDGDADNAHMAGSSSSQQTHHQDHHHIPLMDERPSPMSTSSALAREYVTIQPEDVDSIIAQLPPRQVLDALVRIFFKHVHPDFPLFHRGTFEEEYERCIPKSRDPATSSSTSYYLPRNRTEPAVVDPGWLGCLHMILAFASLVSASPSIASSAAASAAHRPQNTATPSTIASSSAQANLQDDVDLAALRKHCVSLTRFRLLPHFISRCTLANIRALLLLALYLHNHNERNAAWNIVGTATRAAFAMGLHRTVGAEHARPVEREVRRRVFCTLFGFEQFLTSSLGRPSGLSVVGSSTEVEIVPPRVEILDGGGYGSADDDDDGALATLLLKLQAILARARVSAAVKTVGLPAPSGRLLRQEKSAREILRHLDDWRAEVSDCRFLNIPQITEPTRGPDSGDFFCPLSSSASSSSSSSPSTPTMDFDSLKTMMAWQSRPRMRAALVLHMQYRYVAVLSTRASLLASMASPPRKGQGQTQDRSHPHSSLADQCVYNAVQLCRLVLLADTFGLINGISAMDVFYAYCAAMVLILRSLGWATDAAADGGGGDHDHETRYCGELRRLIARTREVLMRVDKCSTMKRFSRVVATFEEGSRREKTAIESVAIGGSSGGDRLAGYSNPTTSHQQLNTSPFMARRDGSSIDLPRAQSSASYSSPSMFTRQLQPQQHTPVQANAVHTPSQPPASATRRFASLHHLDDQRFPKTSPSHNLPHHQNQQQQQQQLPPPEAYPSHHPATELASMPQNNFYNTGYDPHAHAYAGGHAHGNTMAPLPSMPGLFAAQPSLLSLFDGEPEENQWVMDTFLGMGSSDGDIDGSFSGVVDWPDLDTMMRNG